MSTETKNKTRDTSTRQRARVPTKKSKKPLGRDQVVSALIASAAELFAARGVAAVSVREIAAHAGVNHGLIHRHFGSKENLRRQTQEHLAQQVRDDIGVSDNISDLLTEMENALQRHPQFWKVMARSFLDGEVKGDVQAEFPFVRKMVTLVRTWQQQGAIKLDLDPRYVVAVVCAYLLGIRAFERYIMESTGLGDEPFENVLSEIRNNFISMFIA
ncbi:MAG: helix-turn-helix domain-containing protein [Myxococcota bacterium]|nr:helix-turn-helix domain-containing protein [Myxococcota bacterium]